VSEKPAARGAIKLICENRKARHDYQIEKVIEAGIELTGSEVKSCRDGKAQLVDAYAAVERGEVYLYKSHISEYKQGGPYFNHPPVRKRKLLLHKREIIQLTESIAQKGLTLIPLKLYFKGPRAKVELGVARGKTKGDKRETLKRKDSDRDVARAIRRTRGDD
jgi:SsrA-binding protein